MSASQTKINPVQREQIPTSHPPQRLHTPIHIPLTPQYSRPRMLNRFPLQLQIRQRVPSDTFRLVRYPLTVPQPLATSVQPIRAREELLPLFQLMVFAAFIIAVSVAEKRFPVVGEGFEFALCGVDVGFVVAEAGVYEGAGGGGDILFFDAHGVQLVNGVSGSLVPGFRGRMGMKGNLPAHWLPLKISPLTGPLTF